MAALPGQPGIAELVLFERQRPVTEAGVDVVAPHGGRLEAMLVGVDDREHAPRLPKPAGHRPVGARSGWATPVRTAASKTACATCWCTLGSSASGTSSAASLNSAMASAAASFMPRLISRAPASRAPRKMPG